MLFVLTLMWRLLAYLILFLKSSNSISQLKTLVKKCFKRNQQTNQEDNHSLDQVL